MKRSTSLRSGLAILLPAALLGLACGQPLPPPPGCPDGLCEAEPNDSLTSANAIESLEHAVHGSIDVADDQDIFLFTLTTTSDVKLETFDQDGRGSCFDTDTVLELLNASGTLLVEDDESGIGSCAAITPSAETAARLLEPGTYYARVRGYDEFSLGRYTLFLTRESVCGDGTVQGSERCDDHNIADGDGCSHACVPEIPSEAEPNDTDGQATALTVPVVARGALMPLGDVDYYGFTLAASRGVVVETFDASGLEQCNGVDTVVELRKADGTLVAEDDDSGWGYCSWIDRLLPAGSYLVRVQAYQGTAAGYRISLQ